MKLKDTFSKLLSSRLVLNVISVIALLNVIGFLVMGNINAVVYFILLCILIQYFSKNMIIVLGIPVILVNLFVLKDSNFEGMENKEDDSKVKKVKLLQKMKDDNTLDTTTTDSTTIDDTTTDTSVTTSDVKTDESFEVGRAKRRGGHDIDYASTVEDAYDELNKILGSDGIKKLTNDTQGLMKQQLQLAEAMKSMEPMIQGMAPLMKQAQGILGGMNGEGKEGLSSIMEMAKKFTGGK